MWEAIKFVTSGLTYLLLLWPPPRVGSLKSRQDSRLGSLIKLANKKDLPGILDTYLRPGVCQNRDTT